MKKLKSLYGAISWCGVFNDMPAIVGSYYSGSSLYVFKDNFWYEYARSEELIIPKECCECGNKIPLENVF